ncbi:MAG: hypothetical protein ACHQ4G_10865 [Opitutales bacterium]
MSQRPSLAAYLFRDSLLRWAGVASSPVSRLLVAACLSTAAILILASLSLGLATLRERIQQFGLDSLILRTPLNRASDSLPGIHQLAAYGKVFDLRMGYASAELNLGGRTNVAFATDDTLRELVALGVPADRIPLVLTQALPPGIPVRASLGPWSVEAQTVAFPLALNPAGLDTLLIARPGDFPMVAQAAGQAFTLLVRSPDAPPLAAIVGALDAVIAANPPDRPGTPLVQSALPLLQEMNALQASWRRYAGIIGLVIATTIAAAFGTTAILEYQATAYTTALLRSFGASRAAIWLQRYAEAAFLANGGGAVALAAAVLVSRLALPQLADHLCTWPTLFPLLLALNLGAVIAAIPVSLAMRRPVGLILQ